MCDVCKYDGWAPKVLVGTRKTQPAIPTRKYARQAVPPTCIYNIYTHTQLNIVYNIIVQNMLDVCIIRHGSYVGVARSVTKHSDMAHECRIQRCHSPLLTHIATH